MISFSQNREDVVLARVLTAPRGFYVDVGAASPTLHSVTRWFYDCGWSGINIDPEPRWHSELRIQRPRDVNLAMGLHDQEGWLPLLSGRDEISGQSTFSDVVGNSLKAAGHALSKSQVPVRTLASVLDEFAPAEIDFLKIDVEGWETHVIRGGNWERHRPKIVLVEATEPGTRTPSHVPWEPVLINHGYMRCLFDGINRFYVRNEDKELCEAISVPANVLDDYELADVVDLRNEVRRLKENTTRLLAMRELLTQDTDVLRMEYLDALHRAEDATVQFKAAREGLEAALD
jgi:FkbM family methyltransferase